VIKRDPCEATVLILKQGFTLPQHNTPRRRIIGGFYNITAQLRRTIKA
jgi:hypothetical protein